MDRDVLALLCGLALAIAAIGVGWAVIKWLGPK
jgi:hypothetical protein